MREEAHSALIVGLAPFKQGILGSGEPRPGLEGMGDQRDRVGSQDRSHSCLSLQAILGVTISLEDP